MNPPSKTSIEQSPVVNSALWAALGDAFGWITELAKDVAEVRRRTGISPLVQPVKWKRMVGGWAGVEIEFPAGTYSDDTQLRLAVSRSIRGDGSFDAEAFAKIELPVWLSYSLGAGLGSKAAASNLTRKGANWFSNFYSQKGQRYVNGGGNGAAMRIQPHVWGRGPAHIDACLLDVLRNALITHGHPHGFCGAFFHALSLSDSLDNRCVPNMDSWRAYAESFVGIPERIAEDRQLRTFWIETWEKESGHKLEDGVLRARDDAMRDIDSVEEIINDNDVKDKYRAILQVTGCFERKFRGSGLKTAIAASALSWIYRSENIEDALTAVVNELGCDTDTIATMAGAILGVRAGQPGWVVQDHDYIGEEALRLEAIRSGARADTFHYPDLITWKPPSNQSSAVGQYEDGLAIAGLGLVNGIGVESRSGDSVWQWMSTSFGQSILAKRWAVVKKSVKSNQLPGALVLQNRQSKEDLEIQRSSAKRRKGKSVGQAGLTFQEQATEPPAQDASSSDPQSAEQGIDALTDKVIASNFDHFELGKALNICLDRTESIESVVAFVAIIAKAKLVRMRRQRTSGG